MIALYNKQTKFKSPFKLIIYLDDWIKYIWTEEQKYFDTRVHESLEQNQPTRWENLN